MSSEGQDGQDRTGRDIADARRLQISTADFDRFDYIFAMDRQNLNELQTLKRRKPDSKARVQLFGEYSGSGRTEIINDPYYGGHDGFTTTYEQATRFSRNFLKAVFPDIETS